jgi:hypothetical protein
MQAKTNAADLNPTTAHAIHTIRSMSADIKNVHPKADTFSFIFLPYAKSFSSYEMP